jgi:4-hydroxythreonine-4-phosphate dehydrogenase
MSSKPLKLCITTGDLDGIGMEVTAKSFRNLGPQNKVHFLVWRGAKSKPKDFRSLNQNFKTVSFRKSSLALEYFLSAEMTSSTLVEIISEDSPALWVEQTAKWCFAKHIHGMVTGPLSKTEIYRAGLKDMGHTDILKRVSGIKKVHMGFLGDQFNVVLTTAHIPILKVPSSLTEEVILDGLNAANTLRLGLSGAKRKLPIGILGLNPHAGEEGLIGDEELNLFPGVLKAAKRLDIPVAGPLVPDAAFFKPFWKKYSVYLALYHDQGLIPFKLVHGQDSGVHVSVGLPFVRTSVDHGTAKDIFGKGKANPSSMEDAIRACIRLTRSPITN